MKIIDRREKEDRHLYRAPFHSLILPLHLLPVQPRHVTALAKSKPEIELPRLKLILGIETVTMITYRHQSWEENEREHAEERRLTAELIASGKKTAREIQDENSLFPMNAVIEMKWAEYSKRFERAHA